MQPIASYTNHAQSGTSVNNPMGQCYSGGSIGVRSVKTSTGGWHIVIYVVTLCVAVVENVSPEKEYMVTSVRIPA